MLNLKKKYNRNRLEMQSKLTTSALPVRFPKINDGRKGTGQLQGFLDAAIDDGCTEHNTGDHAFIV